MNNAQPGEPQRLLQRLAGEWRGMEMMFPPDAPDGMQVEGIIQSRMELGGWFLFMGYAQLQDGQAAYTAHGVIGYDHSGENVTLHWFDSQGWNPGQPFRGNWDGNRLVLTIESENGHDRLTYELLGADEYTTRLENSADGQEWKTLITGSYERTGPAPCDD